MKAKSIRAHMLWTFLASLLFASAASIYTSNWVSHYTKNFYLLSFMMPLLFLAAFFGCFYVLTRSIVRYLRTLAEGLMVIAEGDLAFRIPVPREDELGIIAGNINKMAGQLEAQLEKERQSERSKMELITSVSHDLRTPLTSITGYLNLLKSGLFQSEQEKQRYVDNAYRKAMQLSKLIDDLFEYTKLTGGDARLALQPVDLCGLMEQLVSELEPIAAEYGMNVEKRLPDRPVKANVDAEKLVRAIDNLLMNALKYSIKPGTVRIMLRHEYDRAVLSVQNQGEPISDEQKRRLFERFYKTSPSRANGGSGTSAGSGLGLSIAKTIVELHGGDIRLDYAEGSYTFSIGLSTVKSR